MSDKPTTVRISPELKLGLDKYMKENNVKNGSKAINELVAAGLKSKGIHNIDNSETLLSREHELNNFIHMSAFLTMKRWEARENDGYTIIKIEELERILEFISVFNDLTHNSSFLRENFEKEGYTNFVKIIEKARAFL
jgi:hypothetical protein